MREIKFRGKRVDNGKWHYGFYREFTMLSCWKREAYRDDINYYIDAKNSNESYLVIPETVGQYTGLKDKNGKEIYEGDIIKENDSIGKIIYNDCEFRVIWIKNKNFYNDVIPRHNDYFEVIGTIYTTPELLKVGE